MAKPSASGMTCMPASKTVVIPAAAALGKPFRQPFGYIVPTERFDGVVHPNDGRNLDEIPGRFAGRRITLEVAESR